MTQNIQEVMTLKPLTLEASASIVDAARAMRERDVGDIIVMDGGAVTGILTDRDIAVRAVADDKDTNSTPVKDVCSASLHYLTPDNSVDDAIEMMRRESVRRLPVLQNGQPVGVVSLGDLAMERDPSSALADISAASSNV